MRRFCTTLTSSRLFTPLFPTERFISFELAIRTVFRFEFTSYSTQLTLIPAVHIYFEISARLQAVARAGGDQSGHTLRSSRSEIADQRTVRIEIHRLRTISTRGGNPFRSDHGRGLADPACPVAYRPDFHGLPTSAGAPGAVPDTVFRGASKSSTRSPEESL